jgi:thioredoxin-related protein
MKIIILFLGLLMSNATFGQNHFITISNKTELNKAKEKAEAEGKILYMIISADWCPACNRLKKNLSELAKEEYFKEEVILGITDYDKFKASDLVWEIFSESASWAAPTNLYFIKGEEYPVLVIGSMNKAKITTKVAELISETKSMP